MMKIDNPTQLSDDLALIIVALKSYKESLPLYEVRRRSKLTRLINTYESALSTALFRWL